MEMFILLLFSMITLITITIATNYEFGSHLKSYDDCEANCDYREKNGNCRLGWCECNKHNEGDWCRSTNNVRKCGDSDDCKDNFYFHIAFYLKFGNFFFTFLHWGKSLFILVVYYL